MYFSYKVKCCNKGSRPHGSSETNGMCIISYKSTKTDKKKLTLEGGFEHLPLSLAQRDFKQVPMSMKYIECYTF